MREVAQVPQLRFPEFNQPLLADILLNLTDILRCGIAATPKYVDSGIIFLSSQNVTPTGKISMEKYNFISEDYYKKISKNSKLLKGDILYSRVGSRYGNAAIFPFEGDYGVYVSLTHIRASKQLNNTFLKFLLNSPIGKIQAKKGIFQGGGVPNLNVKVVEKFKINFPTKPEQQKISAFLTAVDNKIEQLSKKQELLGEYKKGLMQQIFSQIIRFKAGDTPGQPLLPNGNSPSGSDFPNWEEKRLGDLCEITTGKLDANAMVEGGQYRFYTCAKEYYKIDDYAFDTDALIVSGNGANVGYIHHYQGKFNAYQRTYVLDSFTDNIIFVKFVLDEYLHKRIMKEKNEGNTPYIVMGTLTDMKINLPSFSEQTKISNFLSSIDNKIEQVGKQLDESKQFKKALLQQMFV